jgi:bacillithiol system protein YtxJ
MSWIALNDLSQLNSIDELSEHGPVLIFKHSTRCSISSTALGRMNRPDGIIARDLFSCYLLDLLSFRAISNEIMNRYGVEHQSPQVILVKNGRAVYHTSHLDIMPEEILRQSVLVV